MGDHFEKKLNRSDVPLKFYEGVGVILKKKLDRGGVPLNLYQQGKGLEKF